MNIVNIEDGMLKLVSLSERQGYLTYNDINSVFPDSVFSPEDLDEIHVKLHNFSIEIFDHPLGSD
jgi:hypothetical protein